MQFSTPTPATRVSAPLTDPKARSSLSKPADNSGASTNTFTSMYPPLPAYETSLTAQRPNMVSRSSATSLHKPFAASSQATGHPQSSSNSSGAGPQAPTTSTSNGSKPAPNATRNAAPQSPQKDAKQQQPQQQRQTYSVEVSSQALRLSRARTSFTTLRYNVLYALVLYIASSSRPYRCVLAQASDQRRANAFSLFLPVVADLCCPPKDARACDFAPRMVLMAGSRRCVVPSEASASNLKGQTR